MMMRRCCNNSRSNDNNNRVTVHEINIIKSYGSFVLPLKISSCGNFVGGETETYSTCTTDTALPMPELSGIISDSGIIINYS